MKRLLHLITKLELGGAQENTLQNAAGALAAGWDVEVWAGAGGDLFDDARAALGRRLRIVPSLVRELAPDRDLAAGAELLAALRAARPDVVHTHSSKAGILGRLAAHAAGVPLVVHTVHGYGFHDGQRPLARAMLQGAERLVARLTHHVVAVSRRDLDTGVELGLFPRAHATLIRSGFPLAPFAAARGDAVRRELGLPDQAPLVGVVGNFKAQKAPLDAVQTVAAVLAGRPDAHGFFAGDGPLRAAAQAEAERLGVARRIHFLGWRRDVPELMAALDVLLLMSRFEGLPKVVPQALAAGRPVVATRAGGTEEAIAHGDTGFVVDLGDVQAAAGHVLALFADPARRADLAPRARAAAAEFDTRHMVEAHLALYERLRRQPTTA